MSWNRKFAEPIRPPKGPPIHTLKEAAEFLLSLPKKRQDHPDAQAAAEAVRLVAEHGGPLMFAEIGMRQFFSGGPRHGR